MSFFVPRVAAIHDLSAVGRAALTVILPVLSVMGAQVCPVPTAVLSSHLGGFKKVSFHDFTEELPGFFQCWREEGISFDCIYSGFLASDKQAEMVGKFILEDKNDNTLIIVDPVLGDDGKLYSSYTPGFVEKMRSLLKMADVITPNYTEACFLLGQPYKKDFFDPGEVRKRLIKLSEFGPNQVVITGLLSPDGKIWNMGCDRTANVFCATVSDYVPVRYPGTGDIFASVLTGALLGGRNLSEAMQLASDFAAVCAQDTFAAQTPIREGILLERNLPYLFKKFRGIMR